jgi:transcription-repair coupling factor (superfamily II helicase)
VAATFLPGRLRKSKGKFSGKSKEKSKGKFEGRSLQRDGDRVVYHSQVRDAPFDLVNELLDLLDET